MNALYSIRVLLSSEPATGDTPPPHTHTYTCGKMYRALNSYAEDIYFQIDIGM